MKPTYDVRVWQKGGWWLGQVVGGDDGADPAPVNAMTQARTLTRIGPIAQGLIATILDTDEDAFSVRFDYVVPDDVRDALGQARAAREQLGAAQELWQERSAAAARVLSCRGYSLRDAGTLLGLSHQRIDQLLGVDADREADANLRDRARAPRPRRARGDLGHHGAASPRQPAGRRQRVGA